MPDRDRLRKLIALCHIGWASSSTVAVLAAFGVDVFGIWPLGLVRQEWWFWPVLFVVLMLSLWPLWRLWRDG